MRWPWHHMDEQLEQAERTRDEAKSRTGKIERQASRLEQWDKRNGFAAGFKRALGGTG